MANTTNVNGGIVLTIPANSVWKGSVGLSATLSVAVGGTERAQYPSITVSGANASWADGDSVVRLALFAPSVGAAGTTGATATDSMSTGDIQVKTGANSINLILNIGVGVTGVGTAIGEIR